MEQLLYLDISFNQAGIDYTKLHADGIKGVIMRLGYTGYGKYRKIAIDEWFERHYEGVKAQGIPIGVYWLSTATTETEAIKEAEATMSLLNGRELQLPIYWDTEDDHDVTDVRNHPTNQRLIGKEQLTKVAKAFFKRLAELTDYRLGIYASTSWLTNNLDMTQLPETLSVWVAHYGVLKPGYKSSYDIWQYTSKGKISAFAGNVDLNLVYVYLIYKKPVPDDAGFVIKAFGYIIEIKIKKV